MVYPLYHRRASSYIAGGTNVNEYWWIFDKVKELNKKGIFRLREVHVCLTTQVSIILPRTLFKNIFNEMEKVLNTFILRGKN